MKITFRQSGGYAGLIRGCELDTDALPDEEVARLRSLVQQSGILQAQSNPTPNAFDLCNYELTIETNEGIHQISCDDLSLPEEAVPLVEYLQEQARPGFRSSQGKVQ